MGKNVSKMATRRIFAAIDIPDGVRSAIQAYIDDQRRLHPDLPVKWERAEKLHITLKFLARADDSQATALDNALTEVSAAHLPFDAEISGTGVFPNTRSPRVLWLGIGVGVEQIREIGNQLEDVCRRQGIENEKRGFHPHLTIGRIRSTRVDAGAFRAILEDLFSPAAFKVERLTLYESSLSPTGSTYSVLSTYELRDITS
jgi:2'-5' RNA ligase